MSRNTIAPHLMHTAQPDLTGRLSGLNRLQISFLMRCHGLTEAQAQALAALIWGNLS